MKDLEEKLIAVPPGPGVYLHKDAKGKVIYVGKAKSLRNRVRSYFQESRSDFKLDYLRAEIADVDFIVVDNEMEALALENNLIKRHKPKYNILLRDDKTYPYIKLTLNEEYPRILITRRIKKDGAAYFGPYFPANLASRTFKLISRHFQIRACSIEVDGNRPRVCLDYHIGRCMGPCVQSVCTKEEYISRIQDLRLFMEGKRSNLVSRLTTKMEQAAEQQQFEMAAHYRDTLRTIEQLSETQKMASSQTGNRDVFGFYREVERAAIQMFHIREGRVVDRREFFWEDLVEGIEVSEILSSFLKQYYFNSEFTPDEIYVPEDFEDRQLLEKFLSLRRRRKVEIRIPQRGQKRDFVELVERNARLAFDQRFRTPAADAKAIAENLASVLGLESPPNRIECFDISNIQGTDSVASMVVWEAGHMKKSDYRKFIIKTVQGPDDFKSIHEVVRRRYKRLLEENLPLPDLVLIDGGLGQLHAAAQALDELDLPTLPLASIAKKEEILYIRGGEEDPVVLDRTSPVLHLVQRIRDETHRFAVAFHRQRRGKRTLTSELLSIPGVGEKTAKRLLTRFGSAPNVAQCSLEELASEISPHLARRVYQYFHPANSRMGPDLR
ncbi:MAG TPA: excinuclease ABC subunit UvrC [Terriglobia bacterium]|nr:excinuclease ABC subunit UvrC [Terriglobia bacterium]